mgnify:CR=1 FL=1
MNNPIKIGCVLAVRKRNHNNYGTSLQAYATVKVLQDFGYNVRIIRYNKHRGFISTLFALPNYLRSGGKSEFLIRINKKIKGIFLKNYKNNNTIRNKAVEDFKDKIFEPICDYYDGYENLQNGSKNYDICMVGSDQLWHPMGFASGFYNLMFVDDNIPKIAYAASFGVSTIPSHQIKGTEYYLKRFNWISVREQRGVEIVYELTTRKADFVCDPTMLLTKEEWLDFSKSSTIKINEPYIFCYYLGERKEIRKYANELSHKTGYKIVMMRHVDKYITMDDTFGDYAPYNVSPRDFVNLLNNATFVLTDSFHGTIFSIMLEKKFLTFYRVCPKTSGSTHSRIDSLLEKFNLTSRLYKSDIYTEISQPIDYKAINNLVNIFRNDSLNLLKSNIEKCTKF